MNAYLVETRNGLVAVDATLTESDSKAFRSEVEALGKPLLAVLVTHPHPDHVDVGAGGDSEANSVWSIDAPARTAFLGDLTFNGTHSYVADGHLLSWLANLASGRAALDEAEKKELERRMVAEYPDAALTFLIQMAADPVARELSGAR